MALNVFLPILMSWSAWVSDKRLNSIFSVLNGIIPIMCLIVIGVSLWRINSTLKQLRYIVNYRQMCIHFGTFLLFAITFIPTIIEYLIDRKDAEQGEDPNLSLTLWFTIPTIAIATTSQVILAVVFVKIFKGARAYAAEG